MARFISQFGTRFVSLGFSFVLLFLARLIMTPASRSKKERYMSNMQETNRVLGRAGARILSDEEQQQIAGGFRVNRSFGSFGTGACNYDPVTCRVISGDCSDVPPACLGE